MKFLIFILFFALAGCSGEQLKSQNEQLKYQNEQLRKQINEGYYEKQAEILRYERVAAEYEACLWLVDVCPNSVKELGEAAIQAGYSGGGDRFWWILTLKMLALGVLIAASYVLASFGIAKLVAPSEKRASEASEKIQKAQELANLSEKRASEADRERQNAEREIEQLKIKKTNLQTEIDELQSTIEILNDDIAKLKAAHDAFADL